MANLKIKLVKSLNGRWRSRSPPLQSLGLRKIGDVTVQPDNALPAARSQDRHLLKVEKRKVRRGSMK